jgi:hypothetical protein
VIQPLLDIHRGRILKPHPIPIGARAKNPHIENMDVEIERDQQPLLPNHCRAREMTFTVRGRFRHGGGKLGREPE